MLGYEYSYGEQRYFNTELSKAADRCLSGHNGMAQSWSKTNLNLPDR